MASISSCSEFQKVIGTIFRTSEGKAVRGCFNTINDEAVLIQKSVLNKLIEERVLEIEAESESVTYETIPEAWKEQIIADYLREHPVIEKVSNDERKEINKRNSLKGVEIRKKESRRKSAMVLKFVLEGNSFAEVSYFTGMLSSTISNLLKVKYVLNGVIKYRNMTPEEAQELWDEFRSTELSGVDMKLFVTFKQCNCDYKTYRRKQAETAANERELAKDKRIEIMQIENRGREEAKRISEELVKMGHKPIELPQVSVKSEPALTEEDSLYEMSFDDIMKGFGDAPTKEEISAKPVSIDENDIFVEKYSAKKVDVIPNISSSSTRKVIRPKNGGAVIHVPTEKFHYTMDEVDE